MITDLFSHKIHSSDADWPDKLVELAAVFNEFHGRPYDREAIESRLSSISPRATFASRDQSKFRDEISAYPAYLGLYRLELVGGVWHLFLSEAARKFLIIDEPDVGAFMRLQLTLFQYPNGMGAAFGSNSAQVRVQANAATRTLDMVRQGVHVSPFRLVCAALKADAEIRNVSLFDARITLAELFALANYSPTNLTTLPSVGDTRSALERVRAGSIPPPASFESRFHILEHTGMIARSRQELFFRQPVNENDKLDLEEKIAAVLSVQSQFNGFDAATDTSDLTDVIKTGAWGTYFDGVRTLSADVVSVLGADIALEPDLLAAATELRQPVSIGQLRYPLTDRTSTVTASTTPRSSELADPEVTKIKRQRRNLSHKLLLGRLDEALRGFGAQPRDNPHIDLYAEIPSDGAYLFEVKSGGENLLSQIRKGVSQLYEYQYRYKAEIRNDVTLCLVLPDEPTEIPWINDYLCVDRNIALCWIDDGGGIHFPNICATRMGPLGTLSAQQ